MKDKIAIVTGASRGIGKAIAIELAEKGANIVINYSSSEESAMNTKRRCEELGAKVLLVKGSVSEVEDCKDIVAKTLEEFGRIDILVNNAGITRDGLAMRMNDEEFDSVVKTNLYGVFFMMREVAKPMMKQRYGRIINMSSVSGLTGNAGQINYAATKSAVIGMTKSMAKEMATRGITVNAIAPGYIDTDMTKELASTQTDAIISSIPVGRKGEGEDLAYAVSFLASERAAYITGEVIRVDGGLAM